jgi:hypothetical protein
VRSGTLLLSLLPALAFAGAPVHFDVQAWFVPAMKPGADPAVAVSFSARDADVRINEIPAPRLRLDPGQTVMVDKQTPPAHADEQPADPAAGRYLDLSVPVRFPVALAPGLPKGQKVVKGAVTYFYCSKKAGWCRKGTADVEIPVVVH